MHTIRDQTTIDLLGIEAAVLNLTQIPASAGCVMILDSAGRVTEISRGTTQVLDTVGCDVIGAHWWSIWPHSAQGLMQAVAKRGLAGEITNYWLSVEQTDGDDVHWDIRLSPLHDAKDRVTSVLAVARRVLIH